MTIQSYADLQSAVGAWLKRPDLIASQVPNFIMLAEQLFERKIYTRARRANYTTTPTDSLVELPSDWCKIIRAYYNGRTLPFFPNDLESSYAGGPNNAIRFGYQLQGDNMTLSVSGNSTGFGNNNDGLLVPGVLSIDYYTVLESLSTANTSNWLLEDAPDLYLAGALFEGFMYVLDAQIASFWQGRRDQAIQDLIDDDSFSRTPEQPLVRRRA